MYLSAEMSLDVQQKATSAMRTLFTDMYHTLTPFKKKGGCITCTGLQKLKMTLCTIFIVFCFRFKIIQL